MQMKRGKVLTSLSRPRFDELRAGILDGSVVERWKLIEGKSLDELTRKEAVEFRQLCWFINLSETNPCALKDISQDKRWAMLKVFDLGNGLAETVCYERR